MRYCMLKCRFEEGLKSCASFLRAVYVNVIISFVKASNYIIIRTLQVRLSSLDNQYNVNQYLIEAIEASYNVTYQKREANKYSLLAPAIH